MSIDQVDMLASGMGPEREARSPTPPQQFLASEAGSWFSSALSPAGGEQRAAVAAEAVITAAAISLGRSARECVRHKAWSTHQGSREYVNDDGQPQYMRPSGGWVIANAMSMDDVYSASETTVIAQLNDPETGEPTEYLSTFDLDSMHVQRTRAAQAIREGAVVVHAKKLGDIEQKAVSSLALFGDDDEVGDLWQARISPQSRDHLAGRLKSPQIRRAVTTVPEAAPEPVKVFVPLTHNSESFVRQLYSVEQWAVLRGGLRSEGAFVEPATPEEQLLRYHGSHEALIDDLRLARQAEISQARNRAVELAAASGKIIPPEKLETNTSVLEQEFEATASYQVLDYLFKDSAPGSDAMPGLVPRKFLIEAFRLSSLTGQAPQLVSFDPETGLQGYVLGNATLLSCAPSSIGDASYWCATERLRSGQESLGNAIKARAGNIGRLVLYG